MLIIDRVICDQCLCVIGQLYDLPADQRDWISDFRTAPDYAICPDCRERNEASARQLLGADE